MTNIGLFHFSQLPQHSLSKNWNGETEISVAIFSTPNKLD